MGVQREGGVRGLVILLAALLFQAGAVQAEEITCKGSITSIQGEGLVTRSHRFEVADVTGIDETSVLEKCRKIAQDRQNRAARKSAFGSFRKYSEIDLECVRGSEKFQILRSLKTER